MKILSSEKYQWLGIKNNWHVFASRFCEFDPEIIYLYRAKLQMKNGDVMYFDPVYLKDITDPIEISVSGKTSDGKLYDMCVEVDTTEYSPAVCVSESRLLRV